MKLNSKHLAIILLVLMYLVETANAFYDPSLQRWINRDPSGETGGLNLYRSLMNSPLTWIDPLGLIIECSGPDKKKWSELLDRWRKNLPKESSLRKVIEDLDKSKDTVTIGPLTGRKDTQGKQVELPYTEATPFGNRDIWIDFGKDYTAKGRKYSNPEALAHEMLHAHDELVDKNYRKEGDGFTDDEKKVTNDAKTCP